MLKRGFGLFLILLLVLSSFQVYAQDSQDPSSQTAEPSTSQNQGSQTVEPESEESESIDELIQEAEGFDEELEASAGLTPDDGILYDIFDGISESREEKIAEMRDTAQDCNSGDLEACDAFDISRQIYEEHAEEFEREVSPEEREEAQRSSRAIRGVLVREIAQNVNPSEKDELIRDIIKKEENIDIASKIASQIEELCNKLVDLGEFDKASKVCSLDSDLENVDAPEWLKEKRKEWKGEISTEAREFIDILQQCMEISEDSILGNIESCECDKMPGKNADLCYQVVKLEDACGAGEEESCGKSDSLTKEFMSILPEDLRLAAEQRFGEFEDEKYENNGPEEIERIFRNRAPGPCLNALDRGEIDLNQGMYAVRKQCEEIMMGEFAPECRDQELSPEECAESVSVGESRRGPKHGFDFSACDNIEDHKSRADCYADNVKKVGLAEEYYEGRSEFRGDENRRFEYEKKFRQEHKDEYVEFAGKDYGYRQPRRTEEQARRDFERRRSQHETQINEFIQNCDGAWDCSFSDVTPDRPCRCFESKDFDYSPPQNREYRPDQYSQYNEEQYHAPQEGSFNPSAEFQQSPPPEFQQQPPPESFQSPPSSETTQSQGSSPPPESSSEPPTTGGVTWGGITGNAFLDYYWYG